MGELGDLEAKENRLKRRLREILPRVLKALIITILEGLLLFFVWIFVGGLFGAYYEAGTLFTIFFWGMLFFIFTIRVSEGTIFKYGFVVARALFLIIYLIYATQGGVLTLDFAELHLTVEFVPLLGLMVFINVLDMMRGVLQAIEFTSMSPQD
ncbi:MAG: hypothetical protein QW667_03940 [Candidatus Bathyarchaeia archaeon]